MYCNVYYYLYVIIIDIGETLKYLLVGSDEITLETIEVCFISLSLSLSFSPVFSPPPPSLPLILLFLFMYRSTVVQQMKFMR